MPISPIIDSRAQDALASQGLLAAQRAAQRLSRPADGGLVSQGGWNGRPRPFESGDQAAGTGGDAGSTSKAGSTLNAGSTVKAGSTSPADAEKMRQLGKLKDAARDFEAIFLDMLMKKMRETVHKNEMFHGGRGEEVFQEMMDSKVSERVARQGRGFGIAEAIYRDLARHVEATPAASTLDLIAK